MNTCQIQQTTKTLKFVPANNINSSLLKVVSLARPFTGSPDLSSETSSYSEQIADVATASAGRVTKSTEPPEYAVLMDMSIPY